MYPIAVLMLASAILSAAPALAQPVPSMLNDCARVGQRYFREPAARTDMKYNGQRVDCTRPVNGRIFLENRDARFACSFN